jgi:hypothetical protein
MVTIQYTGEALWKRIENAVEKVKDRLARVIKALDASQIEYAVVGGNAIQLWVAQVDEAAVRNTRDVDILLRSQDLQRAIDALTAAGFVFRHSAGMDMFLDGPDASARDAVHVVLAGEKVRPDHLVPAPDVTECEYLKDIRTVSLEALVRMKLTAFRDKDRVHLRDLTEVGLVDETWIVRMPAGLQPRLQQIIETPDG